MRLLPDGGSRRALFARGGILFFGLAMLNRLLDPLGIRAWRKGEYATAESFFRKSLRYKESASTLSNLGALLMERHAFDEGFECLLKASKLDPANASVQVNLANAYHRGGRPDLAFETYRIALALDAGNKEASLNLMRISLEMCEWDAVRSTVAELRELRHETGLMAWDMVTPFTSLFLDFDLNEIHEIAIRHSQLCYGEDSKTAPRRRGRSVGRVRIGYLSSDFHDHPTAHLSLALYGGHDRRIFEVYAYSIGYDDSGRHRRRIVADCDFFRDVSSLSDAQIARCISLDEIDILIDLKGYTGGGRPGVMALRPAPVQINYLGYPGTMGANFIDYIIADPIVVPCSDFHGYSEKVLWMPNSYQPTDDQQVVGFSPLTRADYGIPVDSFVYCCFNNSAKIDVGTFSTWMRVLLAVPNSVLWLLAPPDQARVNMTKKMVAMGVNPERLKFAPVVPKSEHLSRIGLADLTLDTFIYNAHTTTTDSLWAGVPVVSKIGSTFASRVASSLLNACGLRDLIVRNEDQFVEVAVRMARDADFRAQVKSILIARRRSSLFDSKRYVNDIDELLYSVSEVRAV